jgi:adenylate cyclase
VERRLAAILAADVVGYSRLMGASEAATLGALKAHRGELIDAKIAEYHGRVVKLAGDGLLAEFPSVVNAVACAAEIQRKMRERNADVPGDRRIEFRIGVNLGDVIIEGDDILGDGVNVAARLEGIAMPGGIAVSATVLDHIGNRLDLAFEDLGEQTLKNIERPLRVYSVALDASSSRLTASSHDHPRRSVKERPSIAVLPFTNMSGDPEQEYFSNGMTEDIITDLSKISGLYVACRHSVFVLKSRPLKVQEIARELGVHFVVEGSVRRAGPRVRITAQLIDAKAGGHLWAERYDRELTDIFTIQDEITRTIVEQLKIRLLPREKQAIEMWPTRNIDAHNYYLQGRHFYHLHTTARVLLAQRLFRKALELDPAYARAYAGLADCAWFLLKNQHPGTTVESVMEPSRTALELDPTLAEAHASHGTALAYSGHRQEAVAEFERAIALDPNLLEAIYLYAGVAQWFGDRETAARMWARATELAPEDFQSPLLLAQAYRDLGREEESRQAARIGVERAERALRGHPDIPLPAALGAGALVKIGERTRALEWASRALTIAPDDPVTLYNVACTYATLGESDQALDLLERWSAQAHPAMKDSAAEDSDFESIRGHPRFRKLFKPTK